MPISTSTGAAAENENLILTPSKLRLHSCVFGPYVTFAWLPNAIFAGLLLWKTTSAPPLAWWAVFLPQWIGHACHLVLVVLVLLNVDTLVTQQVGPVPPATASPGMVMQYMTMFAEQRASLLVDNINGLIEILTGVIVKGMVCKALTDGSLVLQTFSWRLLLLPCWVAWGLTFVVSAFKPRRERTMGSLRDLLFMSLLFVALKLDGVTAYAWSVVFLIPWMWFGALFLGALVTVCVILVAYTCMDLRELALPGGFLLLLLSAASQLPFLIYLCNYLDGNQLVTFQQLLIPHIVSWSVMWLSGLLICYGLWKKERLRAQLAAAGQVWTAHESAARELMSLELEDMQQQVDKMSDEELAQLAMRMMAGKVPPQQLLRVGSTLYRRAMNFTATSPKPGSRSGLAVIKCLSDRDGTAQLHHAADIAAMEEGRTWVAPHQLPSFVSNEDCAVHVSIQMHSIRTAAQPDRAETDSAPYCSTTQEPGRQLQRELRQGLPIADAGTAVRTAVLDALPSDMVPEQGSDTAAAPEIDDSLCTICYDNEASCVFMECGHGGYCWRCAHVLFARPPSECPVCRQPIQQVLELEDRSCKVGRPVRVKQHNTVVQPQTQLGPAAWFKKRGRDNSSQ